ncbi:RHS repeat domain-containing protein [Streptomyces seoulensis]
MDHDFGTPYDHHHVRHGGPSDRHDVTGGTGTGTPATTYAYDATTGRARSVTDSVAGTFTAGAHDADGALTRETLPGGHTLATTYDPTGNQTSVTYADSPGTTVLSDSATHTIHGKQTGHAQTDGGTLSTAYGYDASGRLAQATDADGTTTTATAATSDSGATWSSTSTTVNHYSCGCDTPSWTSPPRVPPPPGEEGRSVYGLFT